MPEDVNLRQLLVILITVVMFFAGFAVADQLLYDGGIMPAPLKAFSGFVVCTALGIYLAVLFNRQNRKQ